MKKAQLNLNKIFLLFLFVFSINNSIFAQEKEAIEASKKLYKYMMDKKIKNKHTLDITYNVNAYIENYRLHTISNSILGRLGYFDGNDLALTEFIKEKLTPEIKRNFENNKIEYDDIIIIYNENYISNNSIEFNVSVLFTLKSECSIKCEYTNFNSEITDLIEDAITSDATLKVNKLHDVIGLEKCDIKIDTDKCKWVIILDKTEKII